jgi:hypothetical protein
MKSSKFALDKFAWNFVQVLRMEDLDWRLRQAMWLRWVPETKALENFPKVYLFIKMIITSIQIREIEMEYLKVWYLVCVCPKWFFFLKCKIVKSTSKCTFVGFKSYQIFKWIWIHQRCLGNRLMRVVVVVIHCCCVGKTASFTRSTTFVIILGICKMRFHTNLNVPSDESNPRRINVVHWCRTGWPDSLLCAFLWKRKK